MLIIAGDGIRQDAQGIVQFLQDVGHMRFILAMIEVAVYKHTKKDLFIVQPRLLAKTQQLTREISYSLPAESESTAIDPGAEKEEWRKVYKNYWTRLIESLVLDDPEQPMAKPTALGNIFFSMPPSGSIAWVTTFFSQKEKEVGCFLRLRDEPAGRELYQALLEEKDSIAVDLPFPVLWDEARRMVIRCRKVSGEWPPVNDKEVDAYLAETINGFVNVFRPRLARLAGI